MLLKQTSTNDECHVTASRPIMETAVSWSYDKVGYNRCEYFKIKFFGYFVVKVGTTPWTNVYVFCA